MTQEYIETVVLDDPLGEARKPVPSDRTVPPAAAPTEPLQPDDEYGEVPGSYSWLS